jgi:hypothetical protein
METLIKYFTILPFALLSWSANAQGVLSLPEMNVLYRNYDNIIEIGTGRLEEEVIPLSSELVFSSTADSSAYVARISGGIKEATVYIVTVKENDTLYQQKFRVRNLPPPSLFLGQTEDGGFIDLDNLELSANYHNSFGPISTEFTVLSYEILWEGLDHRVIGPGNILTEEAINELKALRLTLAPNQSISIILQTKVKGPDGVTRNKAGTFYLQ